MDHALAPETLAGLHDRGLGFDAYLAADPERADAWRRIHRRVTLDERQRRLASGFTRRMPVLAISGIWCGDCAQQGPMLERIAEASDRIDLRWIERDREPDLARRLRINGGERVPVVVFLSEDFDVVSILGDRTLTRYRALAARNLGSSCPLPGAPIPDDELAGTLADWVDEFERVQLLLRLSPRLRERHQD